MPDQQILKEPGVWLAETLVSSFCHSLEAMTSQQPAVEWRAIDPGSPDAYPGGEWMWWEQPVSVSPGATFWIGIPGSVWRSIGGLALVAAGIDDATDEDCLGTWREIQVQTLSATAHAIGRRLRRDVNCEAGKDIPTAPGLRICIAVDAVLSGNSHTLRIGWSESLQNAVDPDGGSQSAERRSAETAEPAGEGGSRAPSKSGGGARTLDLLLEVELPVSVSFGRAQLALKDVLKLNSGSIVELNRSINEPVEVIVNNCVVARGEVVVVEGNYGVRIKQIVSREERLRTLY
jgi:flagellar motor switch protein FliN/FliY